MIYECELSISPELTSKVKVNETMCSALCKDNFSFPPLCIPNNEKRHVLGVADKHFMDAGQRKVFLRKPPGFPQF